MNSNSQVAPKAAQVCSATAFMRCSIRSSSSKVKVRTVPCSSHESGTTLVASPAWIMVTEITPGSTGRRLRVMMV